MSTPVNTNNSIIMILNIVLVVIVIGILAIYFIKQFKIWKSKPQNITWPLNINECPDYWNLENGTCTFNSATVGNVGISQDKQCGYKESKKDSTLKPKFSMSLDSDAFQSYKTKCSWAKICNVAWDGINNLC